MRKTDQRTPVDVVFPFGKDPIASYTFKYRSLRKSIVNIIESLWMSPRTVY